MQFNISGYEQFHVVVVNCNKPVLIPKVLILGFSHYSGNIRVRFAKSKGGNHEIRSWRIRIIICQENKNLLANY